MLSFQTGQIILRGKEKQDHACLMEANTVQFITVCQTKMFHFLSKVQPQQLGDNATSFIFNGMYFFEECLIKHDWECFPSF